MFETRTSVASRNGLVMAVLLASSNVEAATA
jgi:hypothetical protein